MPHTYHVSIKRVDPMGYDQEAAKPRIVRAEDQIFFEPTARGAALVAMGRAIEIDGYFPTRGDVAIVTDVDMRPAGRFTFNGDRWAA